ncbi:next to BRCA1 gene 1 protein-like isoform X1 [Arapaima gigas]
MEGHTTLKVNFRGKTASLLVSDADKCSWESVEAMIKGSFALSTLQVTYFDEDNKELYLFAGEYEEALKTAANQGNRLHMNAYETKGLGATGEGCSGRRGAVKPPPRVSGERKQVAVSEQGVTVKKTTAAKEDKTPPAWFISYMEKFKDQVVKEAVEKVCREFSGQCCIHKPLREDSQTVEVGRSTTLDCSSCQSQTSGVGYHCSVCRSCTLCEPCSFAHDPSHSLVRARTPLSVPERGSPYVEHIRFQRRGDRSFRKAERQRLKAEKRQLKAEVKEMKKQLRTAERREQHWSAAEDGGVHPVLLQPRGIPTAGLGNPRDFCSTVLPTINALLLDENLPDGIQMKPGTKFVKYWKMKNTGTICWSSDTKLKFLWGNLAVAAPGERTEVTVPVLQPGQVGVLSVAFAAPTQEGTYISHWRLAHAGEKFGPRVWCSIVVDQLAPASTPTSWELDSPCAAAKASGPSLGEKGAVAQEKDSKRCPTPRNCMQMWMDLDSKQDYIPSVDLLTAQDLLSFELQHINIVQELESVPDGNLADTKLERQKEPGHPGPTAAHSDSQDTLSLRESPAEQQGSSADAGGAVTPSSSAQAEQSATEQAVEPKVSVTNSSAQEEESGGGGGGGAGEKPDEGRSPASSASSEDYVIVLPDCFDTSRPLGEPAGGSARPRLGEDSRAAPDPLREGDPRGNPENATASARGSVAETLRASRAPVSARSAAPKNADDPGPQ